ncbi:LysR family transcriptional regulator [Palleronia rufa]|uniref:LysR family transcriptional regulator n=1 Tax=Palleronia rufa TaxID=1530186 RepID=UPI00055FDFAE|nr:LysR family transcriptional regulator [Palleronia rufa]
MTAAKPGLDDLHLFDLVRSAGSISAAARRTGTSKATFSRALSRLEAVAEAPLFDRVGTGLKLTQAGAALIEAAEAASRALGPVLAELHRRYPEVRPHVTVTGMGPDPLAEDLDVVLRLGRPDAPSLIARRIVDAPLRLYVSALRASEIDLDDPQAVEAEGRVVIDVPGLARDWVLHDATGRTLRLHGTPMATVGDPTVALGILRAGHGAAFLPSLYGEPRVEAGDFARALPGFEGPRVEIFAAFPPRRASVPAVRVFIDLLSEAACAMA